LGEACRVVIEGLSVGFDIPGGSHVTALDGMCLDLDPGSFTCVLGPTGCGKTTLLRTVAGLETPSSGSISFKCGSGRPRIGFVFQQHALFPWMTVIENAEFGLRAAGMSRSDRRARATDLLRLVGLDGFENAWPHQLSGGMQQRVSLVRSLATDPDLLLLDEPLSSLDLHTRFELEDLILDLWRFCGATVLFVTHSIEEAVYLADRVVVIGRRPGRVVFDVRLEDERPRNRLSRAFNDGMLELRTVVENLAMLPGPDDCITTTSAGMPPEYR